ncbi:MAG: histidine phosphatase family protein [Caulobacteraceae bacterium]|nr:histidine phosphatase family protein [Caulobacteraceae bacterium]
MGEAGLGAITLVRHGEPNVSRKVKLDSAGYRAFWAGYELTGLKPDQSPPVDLLKAAAEARHIVSSNRVRAIETAQAIAGSREIEISANYVEAPLPPPPWPKFVVLSPRVWGFLVRFWWWWFNYHEDQESKAQATRRAEATADHLIDLARDGDVMLVAHGFFNAMVGVALKQRGFGMTLNEGFRYWCMRRYERS